MNKIITMYELLGMMKDGKAPKRILYDNYIWSWTGDDYQTILKNEKEQFLITGMYYTWLTEFLNDTVEILEEEKKLPKKIEYYDDSIAWVIDNVGQLSDVDKVIIDKLNEVLDYLKSKGDE